MQPKRQVFAVTGGAQPGGAAPRSSGRWERARHWHAAGAAAPPAHRVAALRERLAEEWPALSRELQRASCPATAAGGCPFDAACAAAAAAVDLLPEDEPALARVVGECCAAGPGGEPMAGPLDLRALADSLFDAGADPARNAGLRSAHAALVDRLPYGVAGNAKGAAGRGAPLLQPPLEERLRRLRDALVAFATAAPPASGAKKAGARSSSRLQRTYPPNYPAFACTRRQLMNCEYVERLRGSVDPRSPVRVLRGRASLPAAVKAGAEFPPPPPGATVVQAATPGDEHKWLSGEQLGAALAHAHCPLGRAELAGVMKALDPSLSGRCSVAALLERFGPQLLTAGEQRSPLGPPGGGRLPAGGGAGEWGSLSAETPPPGSGAAQSPTLRRGAARPPAAADHAHASGTFLGGSVPNTLSPFGGMMKVGKDPEVATIGCPRRNDTATGPALGMDWLSTRDERVTMALHDPPWSRQLVDSIRRLPVARAAADPDGPATHLGRERRGSLQLLAVRSVDGSVRPAGR